MLILTRKLGESVIIGDNIKLTVVEINRSHIKFGIDAPKDITIHREEVFEKIMDENEYSSYSNMIDLS
ncbi:MAG: carbon storage regulator CsrA [Planctomycetes bacterium]|nr:carbon storage regulator CsrA [Planctomycetota bacterium]